MKKYKGVSLIKRKYKARIDHNNKSILIGHYDSPIEAAMAYDHYVIKNKLNRKTNKELGLI